MTGWIRSFALVPLMLLATTSSLSGQTAERDLPYGSDPKQRLDLSVPAGRGFATVLFVHGGSLTGGDKADDDYGAVCAPFVAAGIGCANVNYRLAPGHPWSAQAEDVAAAVAWVQANIRVRGGDPRKLFLVGHSSGAMLVALVGADTAYLGQRRLATSALRGVVPMGSIMWDVELEEALARYGRRRVEDAFARGSDHAIFGSLDAYLDHWPIRHLRPGLPPYLFLIAEAEQEHPPVLRTDSAFVARARALGNNAAYRTLPGRTHYSAVRQLGQPADATFALIREFVRQFSEDAPGVGH